MGEFSNKNVLVVGGSRGIGAAIVRRFAAAGAKVTFTFLASHEAAGILASETGGTAVRADSGDRDAVWQAVTDCGPLDILVVNSAIAVSGTVLEIERDVVDKVIDVNLRGVYHALLAAARKMGEGGRIIIIGSAMADYVGIPGLCTYALCKSGLQGMVKGAARDLGKSGITVNLVQPGPVDTDMNPADGPLAEMMRSWLAVGRHIQSDEVAAMVEYTASKSAAMVTGAVLTIDGGFRA